MPTRASTVLVVKSLEVDWSYTRRHAKKLEAKENNIVTAGGHALLDAANDTVPDDPTTGGNDLKASGFVSVDHKGEVVVGYDSPYALRQHEKLDYHHQGRGRAKWLEQTANERQAQDDIGEAMADETKEAI